MTTKLTKDQKEALAIAQAFMDDFDDITFSGAEELAWLVCKIFEKKKHGPRPDGYEEFTLV